MKKLIYFGVFFVFVIFSVSFISADFVTINETALSENYNGASFTLGFGEQAINATFFVKGENVYLNRFIGRGFSGGANFTITIFKNDDLVLVKNMTINRGFTAVFSKENYSELFNSSDIMKVEMKVDSGSVLHMNPFPFSYNGTLVEFNNPAGTMNKGASNEDFALYTFTGDIPANGTFENVNITNNLAVGNNITALRGFFDFLGSSISRVVKGWFTEVDAINITTKNLQVNSKNVCLEDGTNCLPDQNTNILSFTTNVYDTISPTDYGSVSGTDPFNVDEDKVKNVVPTNCLFKDLYVDVASNNRATNSTVNLRINSVDGDLSIVIPGNTVGVFSDIVNTDNANAGDLVNYEIIRGSGGKGKTLIRSIAVLCEIQ